MAVLNQCIIYPRNCKYRIVRIGSEVTARYLRAVQS